MAEVGTSQRVALGVPNRSERLRSEGRRVEELRQAVGPAMRISNCVGTILPAAVLRDSAIVEAVRPAVALNRIVGSGAAADDGEGLAALPGSDGVDLPASEESLFDPCELLAVLEFVVQREGEAV